MFDVSKHSYAPAHDMAIITCFFNPAGYRVRKDNYDCFRRWITKGNLYLFTVEATFEESPPELGEYNNVLVVRGGNAHVLWQKERLLNLALRQVPEKYTKIAWLDCDVIFENPAWAPLASELLDDFAVIQPFERLVRLKRGLLRDDGECEEKVGFGYLFAKNPLSCKIGRFHHHGHTGIAWAARRDLLNESGFYDVLVSGSADHFMAHAFSDTLYSPCFDRIRDTPLFGDFARWAANVSRICARSMSYLPGTVLHLWHGSKENRRYRTILRELMEFDFDPALDLTTDAVTGLHRWSGTKPALRKWGSQYFWDRKEDRG